MAAKTKMADSPRGVLVPRVDVGGRDGVLQAAAALASDNRPLQPYDLEYDYDPPDGV